MNRPYLLVALAAGVAASLNFLNTAGAAPSAIAFPDANLEAAIREALNKPAGEITPEDMAGLTTLSAANRGIQDLTGLEHATSLTWLHLGANQISDVSPLSSLTSLTWLILGENQISDVSPLVDNAGLSAGDYVDLQNNPLNQASLNTYIPQLQARGVTVLFTAPGPSPTPTATPTATPIPTPTATATPTPTLVPGISGGGLLLTAGLLLATGLWTLLRRRRRVDIQ